MLSMTGYGFSEQISDKFQISVELRSLNHRFLEIDIDKPSYLSPYEQAIQKIVSNEAKRGKIQVKVYIKEIEPDINIHFDFHLAQKLVEAFQKLINKFNLNDKITISHFLQSEGIFSVERNQDLSQIWQNLEPTICDALKQMLVCKKEEGNAIQTGLLQLLDQIKQDLNNVKLLANKNMEESSSRLRVKLSEFLAGQFDELRILTEVAVLASKTDINEEIERLDFHIQHFLETCLNEQTVGKKLDFIAQEMHREINTMGVKSVNLTISNLVINMKSYLEKIKEQIRNIE